jgi:hypothetical protein
LAAVIDCFKKNATSKRHGDYGQGLPLVIKLLREKRGFLRLRTGRLSLYEDYSRPVGDPDSPPDLQGGYLPDKSVRTLSRVEGTLVTLLVPLQSQ